MVKYALLIVHCKVHYITVQFALYCLAKAQDFALLHTTESYFRKLIKSTNYYRQTCLKRSLKRRESTGLKDKW